MSKSSKVSKVCVIVEVPDFTEYTEVEDVDYGRLVIGICTTREKAEKKLMDYIHQCNEENGDDHPIRKLNDKWVYHNKRDVMVYLFCITFFFASSN